MTLLATLSSFSSNFPHRPCSKYAQYILMLEVFAAITDMNAGDGNVDVGPVCTAIPPQYQRSPQRFEGCIFRHIWTWLSYNGVSERPLVFLPLFCVKSQRWQQSSENPSVLFLLWWRVSIAHGCCSNSCLMVQAGKCVLSFFNIFFSQLWIWMHAPGQRQPTRLQQFPVMSNKRHVFSWD